MNLINVLSHLNMPTFFKRKRSASRGSDAAHEFNWDVKYHISTDSSSHFLPPVENPFLEMSIIKALSHLCLRNSSDKHIDKEPNCHSSNNETCNWRENITKFQNEYICAGFIKAFPNFGIFMKSNLSTGEMLEQQQNIEKYLVNQKENTDKTLVSLLCLLYSFLCLAFSAEKKFRLADCYRNKANEVQKYVGDMLGKESAWLNIANALYWKSLSESFDYKKQGTTQDGLIQFHLQEARIHFQYACSLGEHFKIEKALCLWWQVYFKVEQGHYKPSAGSDSTTELVINATHLTQEQIENYQMILLTCKEEIKEVTNKEFQELVCDFINEALSKMSEDTHGGVDKKTNYKSLSEQFQAFEKNLARIQTPDFIQSYYIGEAKLKIFIDIDKGKEKDAITFLQKYFPSLWKANLIVLVEQEMFDYLMDPDEVYAALDGENKVSLANHFLSSGSQVMSINQISYQKILTDQNMQRLEDIQRKYVSKPSGSIGGFMVDREGNPYMITASHPLITKLRDGKHIPKPGYQRHYNLPILSEVSENNKGKLIRISNVSYSGLSYLELNDSTLKAIDIAAIQVNTDITDESLCQTNSENEPVKMEPYSSRDEDLLWKEVQKNGNTTGTTHGRIIFVNRKTNINNKSCSGVFIVKAIPKKSNLFAQKGDSGALVISHLGSERNATAYGLCYRIHSDYYDAEFDQHVGPVTWCVRLDHSLEFLKVYFGIELSFYYPMIRSNSCFSVGELSSNQSLYSTRERTYSERFNLEPRAKLHQSKSFSDSGVGTFIRSTYCSCRSLHRSLWVNNECDMIMTNTGDANNVYMQRPGDLQDDFQDGQNRHNLIYLGQQKHLCCTLL